MGQSKTVFFNTFCQYSKFITLTSGQLTPGSLTNQSNDSLLAFCRLAGCVHFKQAHSFFSPYASPYDLYKEYLDTSVETSRCKWLKQIMTASKLQGEARCLPSATALKYHWLQTKFVASQWSQACNDTIKFSAPDFDGNGHKLHQNTVCIVWDEDSFMSSVIEPIGKIHPLLLDASAPVVLIVSQIFSQLQTLKNLRQVTKLKNILLKPISETEREYLFLEEDEAGYQDISL